MKKIALVSLICIFIDQIIKILISTQLQLNKSITIIESFFNLTYVQNDGAAFSIFSGNRLFLILIAFLAIIVMYFLISKHKQLNNFDIITYGLLLGGIIGNLIDRVIFGYVIDYLDFYIFNYNFPVFNIADTCIVISVILILINSYRGEKNGNKS